MRYLISAVDTYRVDTVGEVEQLHDELVKDSSFTLSAFNYCTKQTKAKGEVIDEYQLVKAKKVFTEEKEPGAVFEVSYEEIE